jgi:hypothetical protein
MKRDTRRNEVPSPIRPLATDGLKTYPLRSRPSKVTPALFGRPTRASDPVRLFLDHLPDVLAARDLKDLLARMRRARERKKPILWGLGAHVIKVGLSPVLIDLMRKGWISGIALNGAGIVHDFELAFAGRTSEDVAAQIGSGKFGMARETGELLNEAVRRGADEGLGLGEAVGRLISRSDFPHRRLSLLGEAARLGIPVTVHVAIGTDIIHLHPQASGEAIGQTSLRDFHLFSALAARLDGGGVYLNVGSAVVLPEVFLKAVSLVRNVRPRLDGFTTAVFDFQKQYRPAENVARRPVGKAGRGYYFVGHHEIMIPLLAAALSGP